MAQRRQWFSQHALQLEREPILSSLVTEQCDPFDQSAKHLPERLAFRSIPKDCREGPNFGLPKEICLGVGDDGAGCRLLALSLNFGPPSLKGIELRLD